MTENISNPVKKSRVPMIIIAAVAIIAIAGVIAFAVSGGFSSAPQSVIETEGLLGLVADGIARTADAQLEARQNSLIYKSLNGGSVEFMLESKDLLSELLGASLPGAALYAKVYSDAENMQFGMEAGMEVSDIKIADALIALDEKALTVASDSLLGTKVLGIGFENIVENFNNSVFGPEGSYSLGVTAQEIINGYNLSNFSDLKKEAEAFYAESETAAADFCNMLVASLEENALIEEGETDIKFGIDFVTVQSVSVLLDSTSLPAVIEDVCIYARDNEDFRSYLKDLFIIYEELGMLEEMEIGSTADEAMMNFDDTVNAVLADLEDLAYEMDEGTLSLVFHLSENGKYFVGMDMIIKDLDVENKLQFFVGPDPAAPEFGRLLIEEEGYVLVDMTIEIDDNKNAYEFELCMEEENEENLYIELDYDKNTGEYEFIIELYEDKYFTAAGSVIEESKQMRIAIDEVYFDGEIFPLDSKLIIKAEDNLKTDDYTDILLLSDEEFGTLVGELAGSLMGLMFMLQ